jgi:ubiquinone/menaquinone biosynthesis C-methylase UbiE
MRYAKGIVLSDELQVVSQANAGESICFAPSLFERFSWLYAFWREHLFHDHTTTIIESFWRGEPPAGTKLLEVGCGPGFYACRFAARFNQIDVTGLDNSERLLEHAKLRACSRLLSNCQFVRGNFLSLRQFAGTFDNVIASRIFMVASPRELALAEIYAALKPGGKCFIAEPRSPLRGNIPLSILWLLAKSIHLWTSHVTDYCEPDRAAVLNKADFDSLISSQPWRKVRRWQDANYHYAVCERPVCAIQ